MHKLFGQNFFSGGIRVNNYENSFARAVFDCFIVFPLSIKPNTFNHKTIFTVKPTYVVFRVVCYWPSLQLGSRSWL